MRLAEPAARSDGDQPGIDRQSVELLIECTAEVLNSEVVLYCRQGGEGEPAVVCSWGAGPACEPPARLATGGFVGRALGAKRAAYGPLHSDLDEPLIAAGGGGLTHAAAAPVQLATGTAGALIAAFATPPRDSRQTLWEAESCAAMLALSIHRADALRSLVGATSLDALTGCLNYAGTRHELDREINRSTRSGLSLAVCFVDLDNFKRVNDEHGHLRGNEVLAQVARDLRACVRSCDTVGRFGGDEFIAILPDTSETEASQLADRMRSMIAHAGSPGGYSVTASVGVAQWQVGETADDLLTRADQALLRTKAQRAA